MAQIYGVCNVYCISAVLSGRSTGSIDTASELAIPKKQNQILALESPILLVQIHEGTNIACMYLVQYAKYVAGPGVGQGEPSMHP